MTAKPRYPLIEEIDHSLSPLDTFELFYNEPFCFFLDSGMDYHKLGRYSFIGSNPFLVIPSLIPADGNLCMKDARHHTKKAIDVAQGLERSLFALRRSRLRRGLREACASILVVRFAGKTAETATSDASCSRHARKPVADLRSSGTR